MTDISFLLPTRGRLALVRRFLDSVVLTTDQLDRIEVVLGIDDDDAESLQITDDRLRIRTTIVPRGATMGTLNRTCYEASFGRYVFFMNDDVVCCTPGWDRLVKAEFARYRDDIALIHVNDELFGEKLCTFPLLSRRACQEIGLCPAGYKRYKIDDHIYETYTLLGALGHRRITYAADVVFRHENFQAAANAGKGATFFAAGGKAYVPDSESSAKDEQLYAELIEDRKTDARKLAGLIELDRYERRRRAYTTMLSEIHDPYTYRRNVSVNRHLSPKAIHGRGVEIVVASADLRASVAARCLKSLEDHSPGCVLSIFDGNGNQGFQPAAAYDRAIRASEADVVVLVADNALLGPGWIAGLIGALDHKAAIAAPVQLDRGGRILSSGIFALEGATGGWRDAKDLPQAARVCHGLRPEVLLIDMRRLPGVAIDPAYRKNFIGLDLCLQAWESGCNVVCTPAVTATMLETGILRAPSPEDRLLRQEEAAVFARSWIESGRLAKISGSAWAFDPALSAISGDHGLVRSHAVVAGMPAPSQMDAETKRTSSARILEKVTGDLMEHIKANPRALRMAMAISRQRRAILAWHDGLPPWANRMLQRPIALFERAYARASMAAGERQLGNYRGYSLVTFDGLVCGFPMSQAAYTPSRDAVNLEGAVVATTEIAVRSRIDGLLDERAGASAPTHAGQSAARSAGNLQDHERG